jgi:hypothetical protein
MLGWAVTFLIIALVAAVLGFGGDREGFVLHIPGDVRDLFHLWMERQRRAITGEEGS